MIRRRSRVEVIAYLKGEMQHRVLNKEELVQLERALGREAAMHRRREERKLLAKRIPDRQPSGVSNPRSRRYQKNSPPWPST
jgi:hypothetical protein